MSRWTPICPVAAIVPDTGVAALVDGEQVAVFRLAGGEVRAVGNRDPFSGVNVLARGIVGDAGGTPKVASPVYKQSFDLRTGRCLDDASVSVPTWEVRVRDGVVEVGGRLRWTPTPTGSPA